MKFLVVRFSSIGDIVLTTPVLRVLASSPENHQVHFITKEYFAAVVEHNPYIHKLYTFKKEFTEIQEELKSENYDYIIDLHKNLRSRRLIARLGRPHFSFNKLNYEKWMRVNFKWDLLPNVHIVERYMDSLSFMGLKYDGQGLDYFLDEADEQPIQNLTLNEDYHVFVVGGAHQTKQLPNEMLIKIGKESTRKVVLLGGKDDVRNAELISQEIGDNCLNLVGKLSLSKSAAVVKHALKVLTPDTGLMHITAAFKKEIISIWGNTIPEFGMYALLPTNSTSKGHIFEVKGLKCRPCSKIGYKACPRKHFDCMKKQNVQKIVETLNA